MQTFRYAHATTVAFLLTTLAFNQTVLGKESVEEQRTEIRERVDKILADLYKAKPETQEEIENAVGYAAFGSWGFKLFVTGSERGKGLAHENATDKDTYMKMFSGGLGLGVGVTKFSVVMVFHTREKFDDFVAEGWDFSGEVEASAKTSDKGGTAGGADSFGNVSVYQFTEKGLALEATLSGTRYWQNDKLN